jgi:hypothetical protein
MAASNEIVQPVIVARRKPLGDGRNTLAIPRSATQRTVGTSG